MTKFLTCFKYIVMEQSIHLLIFGVDKETNQLSHQSVGDAVCLTLHFLEHNARLALSTELHTKINEGSCWPRIHFNETGN